MDTVGYGAADPGRIATGRDDFVIVSKAAEILGVSTGTLRNWDREGKLKAERNPVNRYRLYRRSDLERILAERQAALRNRSKFPILRPEQPRPGQH